MSHSRLQKIVVTCKTCDVSESYYSSASVKRFRVEHLSHDVVEQDPESSVGGLGAVGTQVSEDTGRARLLKVLVELVILPSYSAPVFTITGIKSDLKNAFIQVIPPNQRDLVNETLEKGKFLDSGSSDTVYIWEPSAVSFSEEARLAMSFGSRMPEASKLPEPSNANERASLGDVPPAPVEPALEAPASAVEPPTVATTVAANYSATQALLSLPAPTETAAPVLNSPVPSTQAVLVNVAQEPPSPVLEAEPPVAPSPDTKKSSASEGPQPKELEAASQRESEQDSSQEGDGYLLVSRSWYVEPGPKNMSEALRVSRLLRPFRWKVEPAYTIGVIVDDLLSIETATGEIGGDVTKQLEGAGYRLSRVILEKGKLVAWFMKESRE